MLNKQQIKLLQTALRAAGLRAPGFDGRYRMLLGQYKLPSGSPVKSGNQLNSKQLEDLLAICESNGWRCPGRSPNHFRLKVQKDSGLASYAQRESIRHLAGDLGWGDKQLKGFILKMSNYKADCLADVTPKTAYIVIEALKGMVSRATGKQYSNLEDVKTDFSKEVTDGQKEN